MDPYGQARQQLQTPQNSVEEGKIFVGGLSWETTNDSLEAYFAKYGEVDKTQVMYDPNSHKPRGFGFVTYKDPASVNAALQETHHVVDQKTVDPKAALVKGQTAKQSQQGFGASVASSDATTTKKIFVGGLATNTTKVEVEQYFIQYVKDYGSVKNVELKVDPSTNRMRGFGFVEFDSEATVGQVLQKRYHTIGGKSVEVKAAESRNATNKAAGQALPYGQQLYPTAGGYRGQQQQPQQGYGQQYNYSNSYDFYAAAAAYTAAGYQYPYSNSQQASATPQQMGGASYGQDSRSGGYNTATAGYSQFPAQGASTYEQPQANQGVAAAYQQQSYPNNQATAQYNQSTAGGQRNQYY